MAQGAPAAAVTSVEFHRASEIHLQHLHLRDRCSGFVNVIRNWRSGTGVIRIQELASSSDHTAIS